MTLIQEYQQLKQNYNARSSKKQQLEKDDLKRQHHTTSLPSTENASATISKVQNEIVQFIQTLPVPAKDEKKLKQMISTMVTGYQSCIRCLQEDLETTKAKNEMHQDDILELQNKADKAEEEKETLAEKIKKLKQEKESLCLECKALKEKSRKEQEDMQSKQQVQMDDFLSTVEAKVDSFKKEMDRKRDLLERDYRDQIATLEKQIQDLEKYHNRQRDMDKQQQKSEIQKLFQRRMDQLTREKRELRKQLDCKAKAMIDIETIQQEQTQELKQELLDQQIKHEQELQSIEAKVKSLLSRRDKELSDAVERALNAEKRIFAFENCITEIESGLD